MHDPSDQSYQSAIAYFSVFEHYEYKKDVGQLTQKPTHPKTNSPKLLPTHPSALVNSPKYFGQLTQVFGQLTQVFFFNF